MLKVSILLPVYNGAKFLREAIESILSQTFTDFELIIMDDGSTDGTSAILDHYQRLDDRIRVYRHEHQGLIASLNRGCHIAQGKYLARMDADDVSLPERLARQVEYLETHPEAGVLGCGVQVIDGGGKKIRIFQFPVEHGVLRFRLCFYNALTFAHPSVVMRRELLERVGRYNPDMLHSEDYELWSRLCGLTRLSNLRDVLFYLRKHESNVTRVPQHIELQIKNGMRINQQMLSEVLGEEIPIELIQLLYTLEFKTLGEVRRVVGLIYRIYKAVITDRTLSAAEKWKIRIDVFRQGFMLAGRTAKRPLRRMLR
jgi:glycosyltransferase involved in cell wall biosynthesis